MRIGYIRTSTDAQLTARQIDGLKGHCDKVMVEEGVPAGSKRRPVYTAAMEALRPGDTFVVWDLDRAFRSTVDAIQEMERLQERGIEFRIVSLNIDTGCPAGRLVYTMVAALAEWEREMLRQRTREGLAAARKRGKRLGRPPKLSPESVEAARADIEAGRSTVTAAAARLGVAPWTLSRALKNQTKRS
jgi:DNA invertase Pin-like site-specific DNA recombinase